MVDFNAVGTQFVEHYYKVISTDRGNLANLYSPESMLTFEGEQFQGAEAIVAKWS